MTTKQIAQTAVGLGSLSLVARAGKMVTKPKENLMKGFVDLTMGLALLKPMSSIANKL